MAKTNIGLAEYAKAQLGLPYWYGTFGQTSNLSLYNSKKKQYPAYYTSTDFENQFGKRVHDCVGLIKGYLWSETLTSTPKYNSSQDVSANGMFSKCVEKGDINSMPDIIGICVFMSGHIGVYIGNGEVIEARGHAYGVVKTKLSERGWKNWGKIPYIEYETTNQIVETPIAPMSTYQLTCSKINVRIKPNGKIIDVWHKGQLFNIHEEKNGWLRIDTSDHWIKPGIYYKKLD